MSQFVEKSASPPISRKSRNYFVAATVVEHHFANWCRIKTALALIMFSHANTPRRLAAEIVFTLQIQPATLKKGSIFEELFLQQRHIL
jgi:hypothetical protein